MAFPISVAGYLALAVGAFFEGETVVIVAGALARRGALALPWVVLAACAGSCAWSEVWFHVGRVFGRGRFEARPGWQKHARLLEHWLERRGSLVVLGFRFVAGMGTVCPIVLGASGYRFRRYALLDLLGAAGWALVFGSLGWLLGVSVGGALGRWSEAPQIFVAVCILVALLVTLAGRRLVRLAGAESEAGQTSGEKPIG